jgi:protein-tyrosine phosphatase
VLDLHSHLLPAVDDGSRSVEQSVRVLERFVQDGITTVCLTPHLLASQAVRGAPALHDRAFTALRARAPSEVRLCRGAEVMLDRPLEAQVARDRAVTLNGSRYILVEFPRIVAGQTVEHALALVVAIGLVPLLAHPERYRCFSTAAAQRWKALGALLQVDGPTLLSPRPRGDRARELVTAGLADIAAGDNHGDDRSLKPTHDALAEQGGALQADLLLVANPRAILDDRPVEPVPRFAWHLPLLDRVRGLFDRTSQDRP